MCVLILEFTWSDMQSGRVHAAVTFFSKQRCKNKCLVCIVSLIQLPHDCSNCLFSLTLWLVQVTEDFLWQQHQTQVLCVSPCRPAGRLAVESTVIRSWRHCFSCPLLPGYTIHALLEFGLRSLVVFVICGCCRAPFVQLDLYKWNHIIS